MTNNFDKINILKAELPQLTFSVADQRRLEEKFRLEFNYIFFENDSLKLHPNPLSLTYGQHS